MRRLLLLAPLLILAACHRSQAQIDQPPAPETATAAPLPTVPCTTGGMGGGAAGACTVERIASPTGLVLLIRHPDGGFRRLIVTADGRGVGAADGAEPARVAIAGKDAIDVRIGGDRYRLPATVGGG